MLDKNIDEIDKDYVFLASAEKEIWKNEGGGCHRLVRHHVHGWNITSLSRYACAGENTFLKFKDETGPNTIGRNWRSILSQTIKILLIWEWLESDWVENMQGKTFLAGSLVMALGFTQNNNCDPGSLTLWANVPANLNIFIALLACVLSHLFRTCLPHSP